MSNMLSTKYINIFVIITIIFVIKLEITNTLELFTGDLANDENFYTKRLNDIKYNNYTSLDKSTFRINNRRNRINLLATYGNDNGEDAVDLIAANYKNRPQNINTNELMTSIDNNLTENFSNLRRIRRDSKLSLCELDCDCRRDNSFITIDCDFYKRGSQFNLGSRHEIPSTATTLIVKLAPNANLRVEEGLFDKSKVNRVYFECKLNTNGQIEIRPNAFKGNLAPFPDIEIVNCHTVVLRSNAFSGEFKLNITNCHDVIIYSDAFYNTAFPGYFDNIQDLRIHEQAFNNAKAKLDITNSKIDNIYRFEASLREIRFFNCTIGTINPGTFDVITINSIVFEQCKIDVIRTRAITEKLFSPHLAITGAIIGVIENEAINGSGISELLFSKNEIDTIQEKAILVTAINATIAYNRIKHLGNEWLRVRDWSNITVLKNQFGDFGSIVLEKTTAAKACLFEGNFITNPEPGSLNFTDRRCIIRETSFYKKCICKFDWLYKLSSRDLRSEAYCQINDSLKFCFNTTIFNVLKYEHEVCDYSKTTLDCLKNIQLKKIQGSFLKPEELENSTWEQQKKLIYILVGIGILLIISACLFVIAHKVIRRRPSTISITDNISTNLGPHGNIVGDGRNCGNGIINNSTTLREIKTFSNEDRRIINQTLEMMKQKYPTEIFDLVYRNTQILLQGNITEIQRVKTIGDIVQTLGECENAGEDFVAFTDILYKHLAPTTTTSDNNGRSEEGSVNINGFVPDPVYAEPTLPNFNLNHIEDHNLHNHHVIIVGQTNIDHIYAEPNSVQQPLLTNEYASPADKNELVDLYSEPISSDKERMIITPYAVANTKNPSLPITSTTSSVPFRPAPVPTSQIIQQQQNTSHHEPSTSKNLPDVLNASKTQQQQQQQLTNVKKLAQTFSNDPTFHITRSPNTNRRIPKYTIPNTKIKQNENFHNYNNNNSNLYNNHVTARSSDIFSMKSEQTSPNNNKSSAMAMDSRSNHSGGSDVTVRIDDIIEYADA